MARHNADTDSLREVGGAERDIVVACSSLLAISIVLVVGCALCVKKRRPTADTPCELRSKVYDAVEMLPCSDPFTDGDGYTLPTDWFPETQQESKIQQEKVKVRRSSQNDKELVIVTNLGTMTKISISTERLNTNNSWTIDAKGGIPQNDTAFGSMSNLSYVVKLPEKSKEKTKKRALVKNKSDKLNNKDKIFSANVDLSSVSVQIDKLDKRI